MKTFILASALVLAGPSLQAEPGHVDGAAPNKPAAAKPHAQAAVPTEKPDDEVTQIKKYRREWNAYNQLIALYLADHPDFKIFPVDPLDADADAEEKKQHEELEKKMKAVRDALTAPDAIKQMENNIELSVTNALKAYKDKTPSEQLAARKKLAAYYRAQTSDLFRAGLRDIVSQIKFTELNKLKMKFETNKDRREDFEAIVAERKAFSFRATDNLYWQLVTEESEGKPVFPKATAEQKASMEQLWEMVIDARQAEIDRENALQRRGK